MISEAKILDKENAEIEILSGSKNVLNLSHDIEFGPSHRMGLYGKSGYHSGKRSSSMQILSNIGVLIFQNQLSDQNIGQIKGKN